MTIAEIKQQLTLAVVLRHYGLKPDKSHRLHCPFNEDKTPSLQVYYKTHTAYCFSSNCKTHGKAMDVIDFVMHKEDCSKHEAILKCKQLIDPLCSMVVTTSTTPRMSILGNMFTYFKNAVYNSEPAKTYIRLRGLDASQLAIGYNSGQFHHGARKDESLINNKDLTLIETNLYGSSRLGVLNQQIDVEHVVAPPTQELPNLGTGFNAIFNRGEKVFELSNHLGNVLSTVSDRKRPVSLSGTTVDHFDPIIQTAQDYYPFGSLMPGRGGHAIANGWAGNNTTVNGHNLPSSLSINTRNGNEPSEYVASGTIDFAVGFVSGVGDSFSAYIADGSYTGGSGTPNGGLDVEGVGGYRYGFNGMEKSDEIKGEGNSYTAEFWEYDPRIARRWNNDPVYKHSSYEAFGSNPIVNADPRGLDTINFNKNVTTYYPQGGGKPSGTSTFTIDITSSQGLDVFIYNVTNTSIQGKGSTTTKTSTILHPEDRESASGMTMGKLMPFDGLFNWIYTVSRKNYDWESIGKMMDLNKSFGDYMRARNSNAETWRYRASSITIMEELLPVLVQGGVGAYTGAYAGARLGSGATGPVSYGDNIALGLGDDLFNFAGQKGFKIYRDFSTGFQKEKILAAIENTANNLHFNLSGFSKVRYYRFKPTDIVGHNNVTNWELYTIYNTPGALERTIFYKMVDGVYEVVPKPF